MSERGKKIILILASTVCGIGLLGLAELIARTMTDTRFNGNSQYLFASNRFKDSIGNNPGVTAISFGEKVYIDTNGFRVPALAPQSWSEDGKIVLILGDSVAFGPGVPEEKIFAGLLRGELPDRRFVNSAVIGYGTKDYENVYTTLLERGMSFERIFLIFCLNDVSAVSAEALQRAVGPTALTVRSLPMVDRINEWLRERSKLYLVVKNWLYDPRKLYFLGDETSYVDPKIVEEQLQPILRIADTAARTRTPLTVVIPPYAYQLRPEGRSKLNPQNTVSDILRRHKIDVVDLFSEFVAASSETGDLFLSGDPMHLSERGHRLVTRVLEPLVLRQNQPRP